MGKVRQIVMITQKKKPFDFFFCGESGILDQVQKYVFLASHITTCSTTQAYMLTTVRS